MTDIWTDALAGLRPRLGTETYELWLRPLVMVAAAQGVLRLRAPSLFMKEWFENHYRDAVLQEIFSQTEERYAIEVDVSEEAAPAPVFEPAIVPTPATTTAPSRRAAAPVGLSERYRFGTFIKGASNELAASAACAVAEEPGRRFNPLFIYGGVGLGKTHLLHAVGHALYEQRPDRRIVYLSAERFMNEFISAVRFNECDQFRKRYREDCDVLLVDDIQFIAGRDRTMDEFFHVFNALYEAGKQIMVTADRTPSDMQGMEERITSRLNWGLVADIKPPDLETRVAILRQKAEDERIAIADDVAVYLASLVRSNVRELEGALVRVSTFAALKGVPISQEFVREVIGDNAVQRPPQQLTVEAIQKAVAGYFSLRITDLKGQRRHKGVARPRMIAMYLSRELTGSSFPEIGLRFGGKDHSTVINACRRMAEMQTSDPELRTIIESLRQQLVGQG
ncbi:MAG: chromosomal replication initiator protein DnaA [Nannocystaceae bacterium]|nr:chromosomal replication initiator protein DnaA [Deltaproteobacteria bacterium]MBK8713123.1 chromosomal replication initiator protein DnaA [Deltaproteobacteria bacterium]MBP7286701.1 chromosomal replication initiator protein DnaA [Nannocystaceae bacterium]